jgi:DNA repair exonuclease SbcCD nuclease subunit
MRYLHITDIHMGTPAVPSKSVHDGLEQTFFTGKRFADVDALLVTGDVFDEALDHASESAMWATRSITTMLRFCKKHNIVLIVLEGTPLHDRNQSRWFGEYNELYEIGCALYYFPKLTVQHIPELGKTILAVPDEVAKPRIKADDKVARLLEEHNLTHVDIALTHGFYDHLLPKFKQEDGHQSDYYQSITREFIANGHVHTPHVHRPTLSKPPIITGGSAIRKAHGEEEPKGGHLIEVTDTGEVNITFIKNKILVPFKKVDVRKLSIDKATAKIEKVVGKWETGNCMLHCLRSDPVRDTISYFRDKYPHVKFKTKVEKVELVDKDDQEIDLSAKIQGVSINNQNIYSLVEQASLKEDIDPLKRDRALAKFKELISEGL